MEQVGGKVLVLGGTGKTGRRLVRSLADVGVPVRAASRRPGALRGGVEEIEFDWARPETYGAALSGVESLYLVPPGSVVDPSEQVAAFVEEAVRAGVRRIVDLSALGVDAGEEIGLRKVERAVMDSGVEWTVLRPNWFMQNFSESFLLPSILEGGQVVAPAGDGAVSFIDARDIASVAAAALTEDGRHAGAEYVLTGGRALTFAEAASAIGKATGGEVRYVGVEPEQMREGIVGAGVPEDYADMLLGLFEGIRAGWNEPVTGDVERVLGRPPIDFADFARENAAVWRTTS